MDMNLEQRLEGYLDGSLSPDETRLVEEDLARPEIARAFSEALLIRTLFRSPITVPEGLVDRMVDTMGVAVKEAATAKREKNTGSFRSVLNSMGWAVRGPAMMFRADQSSHNGISGVAAGLGTVRYSLAPVDAVRTPQALRTKKKSIQEPRRRAWWRRMLGL
jgi:anti-sigma factor RsiW